MDTQKAPKISVIIPVYKTEQFLSTCIESLLAQTYADFELLLIDDGSPDRSGVICDAYAAKDNRIHVFHQANGGVSSARNKGLDHARGEWTVFVDSDDWVDSNYFHAISSVLNEPVDMVNIGFVSLDANGEVERIVSFQEELYSVIDFFRRDTFYGGICSYMIRGDVFRHHSIRFSEGVSIGEDREFVTKCLLKSRFIQTVSGAFYYYRYHALSAINTRLNYQKISDNLLIVKNIYAYMYTDAGFCPDSPFMMRWYRLGVDSYLNLLIRDIPKDAELHKVKRDIRDTLEMLQFMEFDFPHAFFFKSFALFPGLGLWVCKVRYAFLSIKDKKKAN